jgi:hypothetical protein
MGSSQEMRNPSLPKESMIIVSLTPEKQQLQTVCLWKARVRYLGKQKIHL